jgi:hypothetical protein
MSAWAALLAAGGVIWAEPLAALVIARAINILK